MQNVKHNMLIALFVMIAAGFKCPDKAQLNFFLSDKINANFLNDYVEYKKANKEGDMASFCESKRKKIERNKKEGAQTEYLIKVCMNTKEYSSSLRSQFLSMNMSGDNDKKFNPVIKHMEMSTFSIIVKITLGSDNYVLKIGRDHLKLPGTAEEKKKEILESEPKSDSELKFKNVIKSEIDSAIDSKCTMIEEVKVIKELEKENYESASKMFIERCIIEFDNPTKFDSPQNLDNLLNFYDQKSNILVMMDGGKTLEDFLQHDEQNHLGLEKRKKLYQRFFEILKEMEKQKISLCDFKPDNILFDKDNIQTIKLIDFGAVKFNNEVCEMMTSMYAPPEGYNAYQLKYLFEHSKLEFMKPSSSTYRKAVIDKIIDNLKKNKKKFKDLEKKYTDLKKLESKLQNKESDDARKKIKEALTKVWTEIEKNQEYYIDLDQTPIEIINSKKFDIFTLGVVILEIELRNFKKLCNDDTPRKKFENAYQQLAQSGKNIIKKNNNNKYQEVLALSRNIPSLENRKLHIRNALVSVDKYIVEAKDINDNLFTQIRDYVLVDKLERPELDDFQTKIVDIYLPKQKKQCIDVKRNIII